jgi:hypothetical protein
LVGHRFGGMAGAGVEPPCDPVAHADHRQRGQPLVAGTKLSPRHAILDEGPHFGEDLPARLQVQGGYLFGERGLGAIQDPEALRRSGTLEHERTDHGPQFLDGAEVGAEPDRTDDEDGVLADVPDELGEQLFLAADVVVEPRPGDPDGIGDVLQRGPVVAALGEEPGGVLEDLRHHQLAARGRRPCPGPGRRRGHGVMVGGAGTACQAGTGTGVQVRAKASCCSCTALPR